MALTLPDPTRNAMCNTLVDLLDLGGGPGTIQVRSGTRPASAGDAATGTLLATITLADPAFGEAAGGVATLTDPPAVTASASGTATWFRALDSGGTTVFDGTVTETNGGGDLTVATTSLSAGLSVDVTGGSVTMPGS